MSKVFSQRKKIQITEPPVDVYVAQSIIKKTQDSNTKKIY